MKSNVRCLTLPAAAPLVVTLWVSGCATDGSDTHPPRSPVVEYPAAEQARAADEVEVPDGAAVVAMLSDYAVLRDQARACR